MKSLGFTQIWDGFVLQNVYHRLGAGIRLIFILHYEIKLNSNVMLVINKCRPEKIGLNQIKL